MAAPTSFPLGAGAYVGRVLKGASPAASGDFERAFAAMMQRQPNAFVTTNDGLIQRHIAQIVDFMTKHRLPAMYQTKENDDTLETIGRPRVTQRFVPLDCHHLTVDSAPVCAKIETVVHDRLEVVLRRGSKSRQRVL